ncbi:hypothetical protein FRC04_009078 [Tulasnella sp. 424]|nr:hypothetical protein FRC04_009078 [Tulasnella sp. 424]KAG8969211.1 hypothetical protein FRC05_001175 [Tulasnella sp. 425]
MSSSDLDLEKQSSTPKPPGVPLDSRVDTLQLPPIDSPYNRSSLADDITVVESNGSHVRAGRNESGEADLVDAPGEPKLDEKTEHSPFLVKWDGPDDPENPKNWSVAYRWYITGIADLLVFNGTFAASAPSGVLDQLILEFHLSHTLAVLTISLFVAGYCVGPLLGGPLSEQFGRRPVLLVAFFIYTGFQVGSALAQNTASVLIFRFLGGTFAASRLTTSGGMIADVWNADVRGKALAFFTLAPFAGPAIGPIVGGYIDVGGASWRWLFWVLTMFAAVCFILILFTVPETYAPVIQSQKAARRRKETGDERYFSELEAQDMHWKQRMETVLGRPFKVLFTEPMLIAITLYMSFVYGCIYLLFEAYPIVYTIGHHLSAGESGLMFLPLLLGGVVGVIIYLIYFNPLYEAQIPKYAPRMVPPEQRLLPAFYGGPLLVISFLWFGWTSYTNISLWAPLLSGLPMGISAVFIFLALSNYVIDAYLMVAASALASSIVVRSAFAAGFPLFSTQMYEKLNPRWASTLLAGLALLMLPIPFVLYRYGAKIRRTSRYPPTFD